jgi:alkylation response protein AidB-like acyl-CoA dehydrogenase
MTGIITRPPAIDSPQLQAVIDEIATDAKRRRDDSGADRQPHTAIRLVRENRLGAVRVPADLGGGGYSKRDFYALVIRLGEADPDVPHILRVHWGFVEDRLRLQRSEQEKTWVQQIVDGVLFGGANSELTDRPPGTYTYDTTLVADGDGYRLNGRKFYSTGSLYSDFLRITANDSEGKQRSALIPADRDGVVHADDWDGIGQAETGSGTTILDNVYVGADEFIPFERWGGDPDVQAGRPRQSQPQLILHAVAAGILRSVAADSAEQVRTRRRSYSWAVTADPRHDPQLLQIIGELASAAFVAEATVLAAADAQDRSANFAYQHGRADPDLEHEASLLASKTKVGIEELALKAAGDLFAVGGASATRSSAHLDRHWRNLRTLFSHNPTPYKARAVGDNLVNGTPLPLVGFF